MFSEHLRHIFKSLQLPVYNPLSVRLPINTLSSPMFATCPAHPTLDLIPTKVQYFVYRTHLKTLHFAVYSSPLSPCTSSAQKIFLSTLSSNNLCLYPSLNMTDQILHQYQTTCKTIVLNSTVCVFGYQTGRQNIPDHTFAGTPCIQPAIHSFIKVILIH